MKRLFKTYCWRGPLRGCVVGVLLNKHAWWLGLHYSRFCRRICINLIPCVKGASMANDSTSLQAFFKEKTQRDISTLETRVLDSLYVDGPATRLDLSNRLGKPINCITAPVLNLIKAGIIEEHDRIVQPETGHKAWQLKVKEKYA